jgi:hypothetical protein
MWNSIPFAPMAGRLDRPGRAHRFWRRAAFLGIALAALHAASGLVRPRGAAAQQPGGASPPATADHLALARARLKLSQQALEFIRRSAARGAQVINQREDFYRWSYRLLGDQIYLSMADDDPRVADPEVYLVVSHARPSAERTAAFEAHAQRMKEWEDLMRPLYNRQVLSPIDFLDVQSYRLEADLWLARERGKEQQEREARAKAGRAERPEPGRKP